MPVTEKKKNNHLNSEIWLYGAPIHLFSIRTSPSIWSLFIYHFCKAGQLFWQPGVANPGSQASSRAGVWLLSYPADDLLRYEPELAADPGYSGLTAIIAGPAVLCLLPQIILFCENETLFAAKLP